MLPALLVSALVTGCKEKPSGWDTASDEGRSSNLPDLLNEPETNPEVVRLNAFAVDEGLRFASPCADLDGQLGALHFRSISEETHDTGLEVKGFTGFSLQGPLAEQCDLSPCDYLWFEVSAAYFVQQQSDQIYFRAFMPAVAGYLGLPGENLLFVLVENNADYSTAEPKAAWLKAHPDSKIEGMAGTLYVTDEEGVDSDPSVSDACVQIDAYRY